MGESRDRSAIYLLLHLRSASRGLTRDMHPWEWRTGGRVEPTAVVPPSSHGVAYDRLGAVCDAIS